MIDIIISCILLLGLPLFLLFFFKSNAGILFLASCAGIVLLESLDPTVVTTAGAIVPGEGEAYVRLVVVLLSIVFAAMMFRNSVKSSQLPLHVVLVVVTAAMLWLIIPSATGVSWLLSSVKEPIWQDVNEFRTLVVATGFSLGLVAVLAKSSGHEKKGKH